MNYYFPPYMSQQTQTTGFIRVPHEDVARNWNVPPGTSLTFIDENAPFCYTKTAGTSQFDRPKFERYRLVKEEDTPPVAQQNSNATFVLTDDFNALVERVKRLEDAKHESIDEQTTAQ